jgi:hypothetical protein
MRVGQEFVKIMDKLVVDKAERRWSREERG